MLLKKKISELEQALDQAQTYTEWEQVGSELDALNGMDLWKIDNASPDYNYELIRDQLQTLRGYMNEKRIEPLMRLLRVGLNHDLGNMGNSNLYGRAHVGTKKLIEDYVDQVPALNTSATHKLMASLLATNSISSKTLGAALANLH